MSERVVRRRRATPAMALLVCACSGPAHSRTSPAVTTHFRGLPEAVRVPARAQAQRRTWVAWAAAGAVYVITWGSSSCPNIPNSVKTAGLHQIVIKTAEHDFHRRDNACTSDLAATTSIVHLPATMDTTRPWAVQIDGAHRRLPAQRDWHPPRQTPGARSVPRQAESGR